MELQQVTPQLLGKLIFERMNPCDWELCPEEIKVIYIDKAKWILDYLSDSYLTKSTT